MNTMDPTQLPWSETQWWEMGTTDMSSLLWWQNEEWQNQEVPWQEPEEDNTEMYKKVIEALMQKVQSKYGELNSVKFSWDNQNQAQRNDILKTIFEAMKQAWIDPWDQESINTFMALLEQENPDLYELFVEALDHLLWPDQQAGDQSIQNTPIDQWQSQLLPDQWQEPTPSQWNIMEPQPQSPEDPTQSPAPIQ